MNEINKPGKKRILIIDDNIQIHQDFKKVLLISKEKESDLDKLEEALLGKTSDQQDETYSIDCASQGEEGLKMVEESIEKKEPYAVAFIDVRMPPGWDGIKTIAKIWEVYPELQVVICTAYSDYSWEELFNKFGHTDKLLILKKPFDNIEVRQLTYTLSKKWELNRIANLKLNELERNVEERTKELNETKVRFQNLYDYAPDMYFSVKPDGTVISVNQYGAEYLGYKPKELIGGSVWIIVYKDDLKKTQKQVSEIFNKKKIKSELEFRKIRKDGSILWVHERTHLFLDETGNPKELLIMCRDITNRKQAEKDLQQSEEKYRTMIEHSNDMIWTLDEKGNFLYINKRSEEVTGGSVKQEIGKSFVPIIFEEDLEMVQNVFLDTLAGNSNHYEVRIHDANKKKIITLSVNTAPIIKDGKVVGTVSFGRDITERKKAEEKIKQQNLELQERNEELDDFAHTVAHDLKNPLGVIIGFAELLDDEYSEFSEEEIKDYIKQIVYDSNIMNNIINDLILFSSFRKTEIKIDILNMSDIVAKAINSLSLMIEISNAEITFPDTFPSVLGNSSWVVQVWVNYISNAIKYGGKPPRIKLTAVTSNTYNVPEGMVRFCVRDNGPGISYESQTRLFKKFERLDQVQIEGSGLGLSIVRRIIQKLGGQVGVESEIGKGSLFYFTLPVDGH